MSKESSNKPTEVEKVPAVKDITGLCRFYHLPNSIYAIDVTTVHSNQLFRCAFSFVNP